MIGITLNFLNSILLNTFSIFRFNNIKKIRKTRVLANGASITDMYRNYFII